MAYLVKKNKKNEKNEDGKVKILPEFFNVHLCMNIYLGKKRGFLLKKNLKENGTNFPLNNLKT